jgi:RNA polymerase sigma factor (sigma-70 family)
VARWRAGDPVALLELLRRHDSYLRRSLRKTPALLRIGCAAGWEDVYAEFVRRLLARGANGFDYRGPAALFRYFERVLERTIRDVLRRDRAAKRGGGETIGALDTSALRNARPVPGTSRDSTPTSAARAAETLERARALLDAREFEAWSRTAMGRDTAEVVARGLALSVKDVRNRVRRARLKLARALKGSDRS